MRIYGWELIAVYHHPERFGYSSHCDCGDMFFIRHMTSWEHTSEGLVVLCVEVTHSKSLSHNRAIFCGGCSSAIGDIKYLICHVISQNFVIEGSCVFMDGSSSREGNQDFKENMLVEGNFS